MRPHVVLPRRDEDGSAIILVVGLSVLLMASLTAALTAANYADTLSTRYSNSAQASLAAQSGVAAQLSAMRGVTAYANLPCGAFSGTLTALGATSAYSGTVTYYPAGSNPTALPCTGSVLGGSTAPATATIVSTGTAPHGSPLTVEAKIAVATTTTPTAALGYALYTANALNLAGQATVNSSTGNIANVYSGGTLSCGEGDYIAGTATTYAPVNISGECVLGGLTGSGPVTLSNGVQVTGNVVAYGAPLTLSGNVQITGNATDTAGATSLSGSAQISGNAYSYGAITLGGTAKVVGTMVPNDLALVSQTMPAAVSFPVLNPSVATWQAAGWTAVQVPGTVHGVAQTCASYFQSNSDGSADPFQSDIAASTTPTVYYAPTCAPSYSRTQVFNFGADTVLQVQKFTTANSDTFQSKTAAHHDFSILASAGTTCSTANVDVSISNSANFASSLTVFIYSPGQVNYANAPSMTGQVVACGGFTGSNSYTLVFDPQASGEIPGASAATAPTVSVTDRFVL